MKQTKNKTLIVETVIEKVRSIHAEKWSQYANCHSGVAKGQEYKHESPGPYPGSDYIIYLKKHPNYNSEDKTVAGHSLEIFLDRFTGIDEDDSHDLIALTKENQGNEGYLVIDKKTAAMLYAEIDSKVSTYKTQHDAELARNSAIDKRSNKIASFITHFHV